MEFSWRFSRCPGCKRILNWHIEKILFILNVESGLGPRNVRCASCNTLFDSGLQEWQQMTKIQKLRYGFVSMIYALLFGVSLTFPTIAIIQLLTHNKDRMFPSDDLIAISIIVWAIIILALQIFRILLSNIRSEQAIPEPMNVSFWNWQTNLQFFALITVLIGWIIFFAGTIVAE